MLESIALQDTEHLQLVEGALCSMSGADFNLMPNLRLLVHGPSSTSVELKDAPFPAAASALQQQPRLKHKLSRRKQISVPANPPSLLRKLHYISTAQPELLEQIEAPGLIALVTVCAWTSGICKLPCFSTEISCACIQIGWPGCR